MASQSNSDAHRWRFPSSKNVENPRLMIPFILDDISAVDLQKKKKTLLCCKKADCWEAIHMGMKDVEGVEEEVENKEDTISE